MFVDLERDSTVADVRRAIGAGLRSVEHVKRYTTIGTGSEQGKLANVNAIRVAAELLQVHPGELGTTTFRPPYVPVSFAVLAGRERGQLFDPVRVTPIHPAHVEAGAVFEDVGQWKRPRYFPEEGEDMDAAVRRECAAARESVAKMDASTLGKIDVQGPDAVEFLNRIYTNAFDSLAVGSCRYAVMCKLDGMVFDDGVVMRVGEQRFVCTTTTGNAAPVLAWMEEWLQTEWPELRVWLTSVTEQWATVAVVGPDSRELLASLTTIPLDRESFPFMAIREGEVAGIPARVCRVSFSGELAYEVNVDGRRGLELWRAIDATPYGTETMHVLRAEKGYPIVGQDTDGTVTPHDLGMDWIVSKTKPDFLGKRSFTRADTSRPDRKQLVGLLPASRLSGRERSSSPSRRAGRCSATSRRATGASRSAGRSRSRSSRAAASGSARRCTRTESPRRSSTRCSTTRRERAVTAVLRELAIERQVSLRGEPPMPPNTVAGDAIWLGPDEWLVLGGREEDYPDAWAAVDVSAARVCLELAGEGAADVLARGCAIDLHESVFPPGTCAQTLVARAQVILYRTDEHTFRLLVRPSYVDYLRAWLQDALT